MLPTQTQYNHSGSMSSIFFQADEMANKRFGAADFGARVLQARMFMSAREGRVVSQTEIGDTLGVTGVTVGRWEEGGREPNSLEQVERLALALGVSPGWLAFGEGAMLSGHHGPAKRLPDSEKKKVEPPPQGKRRHG